jgi:hypothetical protein
MGEESWIYNGCCPRCTGHLKKSPSTDLLKCVDCGVRFYPRLDGKIGLWDDSHLKKPHKKGGVPRGI